MQKETNDPLTCHGQNTPTRNPPDCISPVTSSKASSATESPVGSGSNATVTGSAFPPSQRKRKHEDPHAHFALNWVNAPK